MRVTVYTSPNCQPCRLTKMALEKRGIEFDEHPATEHSEFLLSRGFRSAPVVSVEREGVMDFWEGFRPDEIAKLNGGSI